MRILLSGSTGFIGQHLCKSLKRQFPSASIFKFLRTSIIEEVLEFQPDIIFHLAAETKDESKMFESNVLLTHQFLEASRQLPNLKAFINVGSSSEYGRKIKPSSETDFLDPNTIYEGTKGAATLLCQSYARTYKLPIITARPYTVYGPGEQLNKLIPTIFTNLMNKTELGISDAVHDFVYIDNFVNGLIVLSQEPSEKICGDIVNFGTGKQFTNKEVVSICEKVSGIKLLTYTSAAPLRNYDSNVWVCDPSYAFKKYGWFVKTSLQNGIESYYNWIKNENRINSN